MLSRPRQAQIFSHFSGVSVYFLQRPVWKPFWRKYYPQTMGKEVFALTVHVNENCIGCGLCVNMCGNVFLMTEEGVAAARDEIFPEQEAPARVAAESCPVQAIEIQE